MLVCWIALSVAVAPIGSAWAAMHAANTASATEQSAAHAMMVGDVAMDMADMADCHKAMKNSSGGCPCCDMKAQCLADAGCMAKCCKVVGAAVLPANFVRHSMPHDRPIEPEKPPGWASKPPSPPPRN